MSGFKILLLSVIAVFAIWGYAIYNYEPDQPRPGKFPDRIMHNPLDPWFYK